MILLLNTSVLPKAAENHNLHFMTIKYTCFIQYLDMVFKISKISSWRLAEESAFANFCKCFNSFLISDLNTELVKLHNGSTFSSWNYTDELVTKLK